MLSLTLVSAGAVLVGTVVAGVVAHELSHALGLRMAGIPCTVEVLPERDGAEGVRTIVRVPLARVTPTQVPDDVSPWYLRASAMMPLWLAVPFGLVLVGVVPDPFTGGEQSLQLATVAWLGCSIPSPRDFSLLWYPERALATHREANSVDSGLHRSR